MSSTCLRNMVNFGSLTAKIGSGVWGTPAKVAENDKGRESLSLLSEMFWMIQACLSSF